MSLRPSTAPAATCSGDMQPGDADHHARPGDRLILAHVCRDRVRHAKVRERHVPVRQQDVVRLDVAVVIMPARCACASARATSRSRRMASPRRVAPRGRAGRAALAVHEGHDVVEMPGGGAGVVQRQDVWMLEMGGESISRENRRAPDDCPTTDARS